ncbi:hypothetical protein T11_72 [Trichinella zimbabwensis]|uniref:Uncharacterized protein n=1 Tax=Trichinella zimbabwensis TaxID=268475 RepID=A0A0V1H5D7_9BILA|nr:hypothetical protein T11_72 [Trichinella zimbabwensis]
MQPESQQCDQGIAEDTAASNLLSDTVMQFKPTFCYSRQHDGYLDQI